MTPPINIDGDTVEAITMDGTSVSEVTVDGDTVFGAIPDSALTQDLVAWYRFEDGDARDYTATLNANFADTTAYDGTVNGATFQSSGGVTDFESGSNSGAFDFDADNIEVSLPTYSQLSVSVWVNWDDLNTEFLGPFDTFGNIRPHQFTFEDDGGDTDVLACSTPDGTFQFGSVSPNEWTHLLATYDGSTVTTYLNGSQANSGSASFSANLSEVGIGARFGDVTSVVTDGRIDDVRVYNRALTSSEVTDIYNATKP
jgi:hypothetical protein